MADEKKETEKVNETRNMEVLTAEEAADYLHFSKTYIYRLARANMIPHISYGRHVLFRKEDLYEWMGSMVIGSSTASFVVNK